MFTRTFIPVMLLLSFIGALRSEESQFKTMILEPGIQIDIPIQWHVHSEVDKSNLAAAGEAAAGKGPSKVRLLAVSAIPAPTGAKIRVNRYTPAVFAQADLDSMGQAELAQAGKIMTDEFSQMAPKMKMNLVGAVTATKCQVAGRNGIAFNYTRTDPSGPSVWRVKMLRIPHDGSTIEYTQSYRDDAQGTMWSVILDHCMKSIVVSLPANSDARRN